MTLKDVVRIIEVIDRDCVIIRWGPYNSLLPSATLVEHFNRMIS